MLQDRITKAREALPRFVTFTQEVNTELRKVYWPTRKEATAATLVVLAVTMFVALYLGLVDLALSQVIQLVLR